jgi:hypothetical protein
MSVKQETKKRLWIVPKPFFTIYKAYAYFVLFGAGAAGTFNGVVAGAVDEGFEALSIWFCKGFTVLAEPPLATTLMANANTITVIANTQVPFSKKSPVF